MNKMKLLSAAGLAASLMAAPAFAATDATTAPAPNPPTTATAMPAPAASAAATPAATGAEATTAIYAHVGQGGYMADQSFIHNGNNNSNNPSTNANDASMRPSQRNPVLADNGSARASKVIGTTVYNTDDQKLGSVDDILIGKNGVFAVLSTNQKKVAVPFDSLKIGDAKNEGNDKLVLPNETQAKLNTQLEFHYDASNYQSWKAAHNNNNVNNNDRNANLNGNGTGILGNNHNAKNPG